MGKLGFGRISTLSAAFSHDFHGSIRLIGSISQIQTFSDGTILDYGGHLSLDRQVVGMLEHGNVGFGNNNLTATCSQKFGLFSGKGGFYGCCPKVGLGHSTPFGLQSFRGSKRFGGAVMTQIRTFSDEPTLDDDSGLSSGGVDVLSANTLPSLMNCGPDDLQPKLLSVNGDDGSLSSDDGGSSSSRIAMVFEKTLSNLIKCGIFDCNASNDFPLKLPFVEDLVDRIPEDFNCRPKTPLPLLVFYANVCKGGLQSFLTPSQSGLEYPDFTADLPVYRHLVLMYMLDESMKGRCGIHGMWPSNKTKGRLVSLKKEKGESRIDKWTHNWIRYMALNDPGFDVRKKYWLPFDGSQLNFWEHEFKSHNIYEDYFLFPSYFKDVSLTSANFLRENGPNSLPALVACYKETLASLSKREPVSTHTGLELLRLLALRYFGRSISNH